MEKLAFVALTLALSACLCACGGNSTTPAAPDSGSTTPGASDDSATPATPAEPAGPVAYTINPADYGTYRITSVGGTTYEGKYDAATLEKTVELMREQNSFLTVVLGDSCILEFQGTKHPFTLTQDADGVGLMVDKGHADLWNTTDPVRFSLEGGVITLATPDGSQVYTFARD